MKYNMIFIIALILQLVSAVTIAQTKFQNEYHSLEDSISTLMKKRHIPGLFVTVVKRDSVVWQKGIGIANLDLQQPVTDHLFRIGSVTKTFTALGLLKLVVAGELSLYDTLARIVPEVPFINPWEKTHPVLIHHLLEHKAGFDDMHFAAYVNRNDSRETTAMDEVQAHKNALKSRWQPGLVHSYSNPSYIVLGYIIEKLGGKPYQEFITEEVLKPLKMHQTYFQSRAVDSLKYKESIGYSWYGEKYNAVDFTILGESSGAILSNGTDMGQFIQQFLKMDKKDSSWWSQAISTMESVHGEFENQHGIGYGYSGGLYYREFGKKSRLAFLGHSGGTLGFGSDFIYNREHDIGIAISNNGETGNKKILDLIVDFFVTEKTQVQKPLHFDQQFNRWKGTYRMMNSRNEIFRLADVVASTVDISYRGDTLLVKQFLGDEEQFIYSGKGFVKVGELLPSLHLLEHEDEPVLRLDYDHYTQFNGIMHACFVAAFVLTLILTVVALLKMMIVLIKIVIKRKTNTKMSINFILSLPYVLLSILLFTLISMLSLQRITELGLLNTETIFIYLLSILFPIASIFSVCYLIRRWKTLENKVYAKITFTLLGAGSIYLAITLVYIGWFGIAFWRY